MYSSLSFLFVNQTLALFMIETHRPIKLCSIQILRNSLYSINNYVKGVISFSFFFNKFHTRRTGSINQFDSTYKSSHYGSSWLYFEREAIHDKDVLFQYVLLRSSSQCCCTMDFCLQIQTDQC